MLDWKYLIKICWLKVFGQKCSYIENNCNFSDINEINFVIILRAFDWLFHSMAGLYLSSFVKVRFWTEGWVSLTKVTISNLLCEHKFWSWKLWLFQEACNSELLKQSTAMIYVVLPGCLARNETQDTTKIQSAEFFKWWLFPYASTIMWTNAHLSPGGLRILFSDCCMSGILLATR